MIISIERLKERYPDISDVTQDDLDALEDMIRHYTHNPFQNRAVRSKAYIKGGKIQWVSPYLKVGGTLQITKSDFNDGIYTITAITSEGIAVDKRLYDSELQCLVTLVEYPPAIVRGLLDIILWKDRNSKWNNGENTPVQSETISRHSVTYQSDSTESDIDENFGVPKKYLAFMKLYKKARF